jgi:hypothetical protein
MITEDDFYIGECDSCCFDMHITKSLGNREAYEQLKQEIIQALAIKKRLEEYMKKTTYGEFREKYEFMMILKEIRDGDTGLENKK